MFPRCRRGALLPITLNAQGLLRSIPCRGRRHEESQVFRGHTAHRDHISGSGLGDGTTTVRPAAEGRVFLIRRTARSHPDSREVQARQKRFSRNTEEWLIRDYFRDRRNGAFLDVGANDYRNESNTYLETQLGWSGVAIDALEEFAAGYQEHRPRTQFFALLASDVADLTAQFFVPDTNKLVTSVSRKFTEDEGHPGVAQAVPTTTLDVVLAKAGLSRLDFMSMDIELSEPKALAGFDIDRFHPALRCIEAHEEVRQRDSSTILPVTATPSLDGTCRSIRRVSISSPSTSASVSTATRAQLGDQAGYTTGARKLTRPSEG